jgi:hypothetical protein
MSPVGGDRTDSQGGPVEHHGGPVSGDEMPDVDIAVAENRWHGSQPGEQIMKPGPEPSEPRIRVDRRPVQVADREMLREPVASR